MRNWASCAVAVIGVPVDAVTVANDCRVLLCNLRDHCQHRPFRIGGAETSTRRAELLACGGVNLPARSPWRIRLPDTAFVGQYRLDQCFVATVNFGLRDLAGQSDNPARNAVSMSVW